MTLKLAQGGHTHDAIWWACITFFQYSVVTISLSSTVSKILPLLQCTWTWLPVTLRSPWISIKWLHLQITHAFWFAR